MQRIFFLHSPSMHQAQVTMTTSAKKKNLATTLPRDAEATTMQASRVPAAPAADNTSVCLSGLFALGLVPHSTLCLFCYSFPCACVRVSAQHLHVFLACVSTCQLLVIFFFRM